MAWRIYRLLPDKTFEPGFITQPRITATVINGENAKEVTNLLEIVYHGGNYNPNNPLTAFRITWNDGANTKSVNARFFKNAGFEVTSVDCGLNRKIDETDTKYYWKKLDKLRDAVTNAKGLDENKVTEMKRACEYAYRVRLVDTKINFHISFKKGALKDKIAKYREGVRKHLPNLSKLMVMIDHVNEGRIIYSKEYRLPSDIPGY